MMEGERYFHEKWSGWKVWRGGVFIYSFFLDCYACVLYSLRMKQGSKPVGSGGPYRKNIVLISASGILDVQSLVSSGKFEREFGKLEL